jgi:membrane-associated phospholipid phosphatase
MELSIGYYGPYLLLGINSVLLWNQRPYLQAFLGGFFMNIGINQVLKSIIREDRPNHRIEEYGYGMPSLHAQSVWYCTVFVYAVQQSFWVFIAEGCLCVLTMYQRWKTEMHSYEQLIVGSLLGGFISYSIYEYTRGRLEDSGESYPSIL